MGALTGAIRLVRHVVEGQDTIDIDDGVLGAVAVEVELLRSTPECHPAFKLDVRDSVFEHLSTHTTDQKRIGRGSNR